MQKSNSNIITIVVVDDKFDQREKLKNVFVANSRFRLIARFETGQAALDECRALSPDILIIDVNLSDMYAIDLVKQLKKILPGTAFVRYSFGDDPEIVQAFMREGVFFHIYKWDTKDNIQKAIQTYYDQYTTVRKQLARNKDFDKE